MVVCSLSEDNYAELPFVKLKVRRTRWLSRARSRRVLRNMDREGEAELVRLRYGDDCRR